MSWKPSDLYDDVMCWFWSIQIFGAAPPSATIFSEPPLRVSKNFRSSPSISSSPPCHIKWTFALRLRIFRDTLILVFVNENCCLFKCFTELYFFYWLLEVSFAILIAVPFVFSLSWTSLAGVLKMSRVSNAFQDYTSL